MPLSFEKVKNNLVWRGIEVVIYVLMLIIYAGFC